MPPELEKLLSLATGIPPGLIYLLLGAGAAIENLFPPVPSDTFVLLGGILADQGLLKPWLVLVIAWASNVGSALFVYYMARKYGRAIFRTSWGRWLLRPHQLELLAEFYGRYGLVAIFGSRFLPVVRVVVPAFAGISNLGILSTSIPLAVASALWYSVVLYAGMLASRNVGRLLEWFNAANDWLLGAALLVVIGFLIWWWRTRAHRLEEREKDGEAEADES